jgi:hypothetical protein
MSHEDQARSIPVDNLTEYFRDALDSAPRATCATCTGSRLSAARSIRR